MRDFKDLVLRETGCKYTRHFPFEWVFSKGYGSPQFLACIAFWDKVCSIGEQNIHLMDKMSDIDKSVELTDEQWRELEAEFRQLI